MDISNDRNPNNISGDENPWESAANDQQWNDTMNRGQQEDTTAFLNNTQNNISAITTASTTAGTTTRQTSPNSSIFWKLPYSIDMLVALLVGGYISYRLIVDNKQHEYFIAGCCWLVICALGVLRGMFASGLRPGSKFLLHLIYQSHWLASLVFGIFSVTLWIMYLLEKKPPSIPYIDEFLFWNQNEYPKALPSIMLAMSIWEGLRYMLVKCFVLDNSNNDGSGGTGNDGNTTIATPHSRRSIPWWWNHQQRRQQNQQRSQSGEPLLDGTSNPNWTHEGRRGNYGYYEDHGIETTSSTNNRSWWPFGSRRSSNNGHDPRDDGSVDYASLSEDWASRSQDDPLWWSRDESTTTAGGRGGVPSNV